MPGLHLPVEQHGPVPDASVECPLSAAWITDELVEATRRVWSPVYGRVLSADEAVEILVNVKQFAAVLLKTRRGRKPK